MTADGILSTQLRTRKEDETRRRTWQGGPSLSKGLSEQLWRQGRRNMGLGHSKWLDTGLSKDLAPRKIRRLVRLCGTIENRCFIIKFWWQWRLFSTSAPGYSVQRRGPFDTYKGLLLAGWVVVSCFVHITEPTWPETEFRNFDLNFLVYWGLKALLTAI
jgi:hypothetical protein